MTKKICILSYSSIPDDPRVRNHAEAFFKANWSVTAVGLGGFKSKNPDWIYIRSDISAVDQKDELELPVSNLSEARDNTIPKNNLRLIVDSNFYRYLKDLYNMLLRITFALRRIALNFPPRRFERALKAFWRVSPNLKNLYVHAREIEADIWLANDWLCLPIAYQLSKEKGGIFTYDTHEFAVKEYEENFRWRIIEQPLIRALEKRLLPKASLVSTVSFSIARDLEQCYKLQNTINVILNVPKYSKHIVQTVCSKKIKVLYHGVVSHGRGLEETIRSVTQWRPEFILSIRGPASDEYKRELNKLISENDLEGRVQLLPAIPMVELVNSASIFDVGIFALPNHSLQNEYALPNKLFEYIMAGLALCVSNLSEMKNIIRHYDLGVLIDFVNEKSIASSINSLNKMTIERFKANSLKAAMELNWDKESLKLIKAYDGLR